PVVDQLGDKRLLIVAEGALQYLPFQTLPVPTQGYGDAETRRPGEAVTPLILEHEIVNLPSASVLAVLREQIRDRQSASKAVAVIADRVFEADDPRVMPEAETRGNGDAGKAGSGETATADDSVSRTHGDAGEAPARLAASPGRRGAVSTRPTEVSDLH